MNRLREFYSALVGSPPPFLFASKLWIIWSALYLLSIMGILKGGMVGIFIMLLPVEAPMAPISTAGMAISRHPMEAV